ncbi:MAG: MerR family transcriptional regulator [Treponema sp.]|nr:MerR family transcriptional regulator [Treponema sp.]
MATMTIGEVEQLTGVKAHVLRYWEEHIPFLSPQKDGFGRRFYSSRDIQLILRLKYLVVDRKFTVGGAAEQLIRESVESDNSTLKADINQLKNELIDLYVKVKAQKE